MDAEPDVKTADDLNNAASIGESGYSDDIDLGEYRNSS